MSWENPFLKQIQGNLQFSTLPGNLLEFGKISKATWNSIEIRSSNSTNYRINATYAIGID